MTDKNELRRQYTKIRDGFEYRNTADSEIFKAVISSPHFIGAESIFVYHSFKTEVDTHKIIDFCLENYKQIYIPKVVGKKMFSSKYEKSCNNISKYGILESNDYTDRTDFDLIIVPMLAFDARCYRLGYGGGFYDKFLENNRSYTIGLAYSVQFFEKLPNEYFDKPLDCIITEKKIFYGGNR